MKEECKKLIKEVEEILEKELTTLLTEIKTANKFAPGQTDTLKEATELMIMFKELEGSEEYSNGMDMAMGMNAYAPRRNPYNGRYMSNNYAMGYSGHSIQDRMVAGLEDVMGVAKNKYEADMISKAINYVHNLE